MQKDQSQKPWYKRLWVIIVAVLTFLSIVTALVTDIFDFFDRFPKESKKTEVIKIYGSVFEKKKELRPVYNASIRFLNIREERTDTNGYFSAQLNGYGADSITIEVVLPDEQKLNRKIFIEYNKKEMFLAPLIFPVNNITVLTEITKGQYTSPPGIISETDSNTKIKNDVNSKKISETKQNVKATDDKPATTTTFLPPASNNVQGMKKKEETFSKNEFIAECLVTNSAGNQLQEILQDVGTVLEEAGNTVVISNAEGVLIQDLNGKYNKFATVSVKLNDPTPNTTDARTISIRYAYSIKLYNVNTKKLITSAAAQDVQPGFNKEEAVSAIKKIILSHLKEKL